MDNEQLIKQVDWLDEERRKDKTKIGSLEERVEGLEENMAEVLSQLRELTSEINRFSTIITRIVLRKNYGSLLDYSDGSRNEPDCPDCNDWGHLDISFFQTASGMVEGIPPPET